MRYLSILLLFLVQCSFAQNSYNLIPYPQKLTAAEGSFSFSKKTSIAYDNDALKPVADMLASQVSKSLGGSVVVKKGKSGTVVFTSNATLGEEAYNLNISSHKINVSSKNGKGAFYALQSILQLMPASSFAENAKATQINVPNCSIEDAPRFSYRSLMLDAGRHFFTPDEVKHFIDLMAMYKLNNLHWHLTEDQGWRIEIKKYPLLTKISSVRKESTVGHYRENKFDGKPYGGFYTQDQVKDIVAYAAKKYINIIPEIEMPGHSQAVLAAYPQFGGNPDKIYEVRTKWGVSEDVLLPREETFKFLEDVLTEVMDLFPGQYIHIGGDECPKTQWKESRFCQDMIKKLGLKDEHELQSYFIRRIDKFITSKGKKMLGWDEILEGGLSPNAMVMSWRGVKGGVEAAKQNHDVVMSPNSFFYLDYYQGDSKTEPLAIGGNLPLSKCYSFEPYLPELTEQEAKHVMGVQANLWTEYIGDIKYVEYMTYPRALALAEVAWAPRKEKNYEEFKSRVTGHSAILDALKVNYSKAYLKQ